MLIHFELPTRSLSDVEFFSPSKRYGQLPVDVVETTNGTIVYAELPGVQKDQVRLTVEDDVLTIAGSRSSQPLPEDARYILREQTLNGFERHIPVGHSVDPKTMTATLENGLLRVELPKAEEARPRTIEIR